jgi:RimJ/RimL family protein N-acetyltransferase
VLPIQTDRLTLRRLALDDAEFVVVLLNDESFLRYIGDRGVRDLPSAREYITKGPLASYRRNGFGLYLVVLKDSDVPIGMCGLVKREGLDDVDLGFALMPAYRSRGYAAEAATAVMAYARDVVGLERVVAITSPDNERSMRLLESLGFRFEKMIRLPPEQAEIRLYGWSADVAAASRSQGS